MTHIRSRGAVATSVATTALLLILGACGSGSGGSDEGSGAELSSADKEKVVADAEARVADALRTTAEDVEPPPTDKYDPGTKKVMVISCSQAAPACAAQSAAAVDAAKAAGWETTPIRDPQFQTDKLDSFVNEAINQDYDAIIYASSNPNDIVPTVKLAAEAGIAQVAFNNPVSDELKDDVIQVTPDNVERGHLIGDWIIATSKCDGTVEVFDDPAFAVTTLQVGSVVEQIKQCGSSLKVGENDIPSSDSVKPGPPYWTAALAQHPSGQMDFAVAPYDSIAAPMARTAADQGRTDVKITGFDGAPENVKLIASGEQAVAVTSPFEYLAWIAVDQAARKLAGAPLYDATEIPARLVTKENAASFPNFWEPENFDFKAMFQANWS